MSVELVNITIDGVAVSVPKGTLVIRAAETIGTYIPRFCDHPLLDPLGACRQCLVEVEGQRKPLTACTTTATEGMVVKTQFSSEIAKDAQEGVLELLLINHPLDCPMCDKGGECPLQDQALAYGPGGSRYIDGKRRFTKPVPISPLIKLDRERCVLCARCTRFSEQIAGDPFIELFERGALEQVAIYEDEPYESIFSGNVAQICPVGALTSSSFRFRARPFDVVDVASTCNRCASGCSVALQSRRGQLVRVLARENHEVNDEWICDKGRYAHAYATEPQRVTEPLIRKNGEFVAVSWSEALTAVADGVRAGRDAGRQSAVLTGGNLLDEDTFAVSLFARDVLGFAAIDARMRASTAEENEILSIVATSRGATNADIDAASVIVIAGADLHEESPIVWLRIRKAARRGATVIEISPRRTTGKIRGARWVPCAPGAEAATLLAVAKGLESRAGGLDPFTRVSLSESSGAIADVDVSAVADALVAPDAKVVVLAGERLAASNGALSLALNLSVALHGTFGWIPRKAGAPAALRYGLMAGDAKTILERAGSLGSLFLIGADPARDFADPAFATRSLDASTFTVALDLFLTQSATRAHVVLPVLSAYERTGTITNWEGRAQPVAPGESPAGLANADHEILAQISQALGVSFPSTRDAVRKQMRHAAPAKPGPARAVSVPKVVAAPTGARLLAYPLLLDDGTMMAGADELRATAPPAVIEIHPSAGIANGAQVRVSSSAGVITGTAKVTDAVAPGAVFVPLRAPGLDATGLLVDGEHAPPLTVEAV